MITGFLVYGIAVLARGNGFLAVYVAGLTMGENALSGGSDRLTIDGGLLGFGRLASGEFIGVVGLDVLAATLETVLAPGLDVAPVNCVVINSGGRVVAAAEPTLLVGDLIRGLPLAPWFAGESAEHEDWDFSPAGALRLGVLSAR